MLKLVTTIDEDGETIEVPLLDDGGKPTKLLAGLMIAEFLLDLYAGYAAYRFFKARAERIGK